MKWYKRDPHRWLEGTREIPFEAKGFYADLIEVYMARDGRLPNNDRFLAKATGGDVRVVRRLKKILIEIGKVRLNFSGTLVPNGVEVTMNEAESFSEVQSIKAKKRWKNNTTPDAKVAYASGNASTPTTREEEEEEEAKASSSSSSDVDRAKTPPVDNPPAGSLASAANGGALAPPPTTKPPHQKVAAEQEKQPTSPDLPWPHPYPKDHFRDKGLDYRSPPATKNPTPVQNLEHLLAQAQTIRKKGPPFT